MALVVIKDREGGSNLNYTFHFLCSVLHTGHLFTEPHILFHSVLKIPYLVRHGLNAT